MWSNGADSGGWGRALRLLERDVQGLAGWLERLGVLLLLRHLIIIISSSILCHHHLLLLLIVNTILNMLCHGTLATYPPPTAPTSAPSTVNHSK